MLASRAEVHFEQGEVIQRRGSTLGAGLHIIRSGLVLFNTTLPAVAEPAALPKAAGSVELPEALPSDEGERPVRERRVSYTVEEGDTLGEGDIFGEASLLRPAAPHELSAVAATDVVCVMPLDLAELSQLSADGRVIRRGSTLFPEPKPAIEFGELELFRTLGVGGYGAVKLAVHKQTQQVCVIKQMSKRAIVQKKQVAHILAGTRTKSPPPPP